MCHYLGYKKEKIFFTQLFARGMFFSSEKDGTEMKCLF